MQEREALEEEEHKQIIARDAMAKIKEMSDRRVQLMGQIQMEIARLKTTVGEKQEEIDRLKGEKLKMQNELNTATALS